MNLFPECTPPEGPERAVTISLTLWETLKDHEARGGLKGGFQKHLADTLRRIDEERVLTYDDAYLGQTWRHAHLYGEGGWQNVCRHILGEIQHPPEHPW